MEGMAIKFSRLSAKIWSSGFATISRECIQIILNRVNKKEKLQFVYSAENRVTIKMIIVKEKK